MCFFKQYKENDVLWYWFVNMKGIGMVTRRNLLHHFGHPRSLYAADDSRLARLLTPRQMTYYKESKNMNAIENSMNKLKAEQVRFLHWESPDYPERLRRLPDPPYGLYLRGKLPDSELPSIAMIGSRRATNYGRRIAECFAKELAGYGFQIISGLAEGIDAASHLGALKGEGYTLGVLGGGIDSIYPRENFNLYWEMYEKGGVLSEWNLGVPNHPGMFPVRNRLISALADGVFVLEAAKKSGTFITVDWALEQGRTVFALPGRITDVNSIGTNQLISDGAIPVMTSKDIIDYFEMEGFSFASKKLNNKTGKDTMEMIDTCNNIREPDKRRIFDLLDEREPRDFASLLHCSGFEIGKLSHILYELELSGMIFQSNQNVYFKKINNIQKI